jgi:hypothetical protein
MAIITYSSQLPTCIYTFALGTFKFFVIWYNRNLRMTTCDTVLSSDNVVFAFILLGFRQPTNVGTVT